MAALVQVVGIERKHNACQDASHAGARHVATQMEHAQACQHVIDENGDVIGMLYLGEGPVEAVYRKREDENDFDEDEGDLDNLLWDDEQRHKARRVWDEFDNKK